MESAMEDLEPDQGPEEDITLTADALKAMGHPLRWKILCTLGNKEMSVGEIVEKIGTSQSNVSQHLDQLRNKNIVSSRRDANRIYYSVKRSIECLKHSFKTFLGSQHICPGMNISGT